MRIQVTMTLLLMGLAPSMAHAQTHVKFAYEGYLARSDGTPVNGSLGLVLTIWDAPEAGNALFTESRTVTATSGYFSFVIGSITPLPASLFETAGDRYLGFMFEQDVVELEPRTPLIFVPYAVHALFSDSG